MGKQLSKSSNPAAHWPIPLLHRALGYFPARGCWLFLHSVVRIVAAAAHWPIPAIYRANSVAAVYQNEKRGLNWPILMLYQC